MTVPSSPRVRPRTTILLAAAFAASAALPAPALGPEDFEWLVEPLADINQGLVFLEDRPVRFAQHGGILYYSSDGTLWRTDGTEDGTKALRVGPGGNTIRSISSMLPVPDGFYFTSTAHGAQIPLWFSDGTIEETWTVSPPSPDVEVYNPSYLTLVGDLLFFSAGDNQRRGSELWATHRATQESFLVKDINPTIGSSSSPVELTEVGGVLYFNATDGIHSRELWRSDGTPDGTYMVKNINATSQSNPRKLTAVGDRLFFTANDGTSNHGLELWTSDGTEEGTHLVFDSRPGAGGLPSSAELCGMGGDLYITASGETAGLPGQILWRTDGTPAGTAPVFTDPLTLPADPMHLGVADGHLFFSAVDPDHGRQVFRSDGTASGTVRLTGGGPFNLFGPLYLAKDGVVYFGGNGSIWRTDGTPEGTAALTDPGRFSMVHAMHDMGGVVVFAGITSPEGRNLWITDGTPEGTRRLRESAVTTEPSNPDQHTDLDGILLFQANEGPTGTALWRSDGTPEGTLRVADIRPGAQDAGIVLGAVMDGEAYFGANDGVHGSGLWATDGTEEGTRMIAPIAPGSATATRFAAFGDGLVGFVAAEHAWGGEVWRSDGTADGTFRLSELTARSSVPGASLLFPALGELYFVGTDYYVTGTELYATDGTIEGTRMVTNLFPSSNGLSTQPRVPVAMGDAFYFAGRALGMSGDYLYRSDGTTEGTSIVSDLPLFPIQSEQSKAIVLLGGDRLLFSATGPGGRQLGISDGTDEGTSILKVINQGTHSDPLNFAVSGDTVFFSANDGVHGRELWATDGTEGGTRLVKDIASGSSSSSPSNLVAAGGVVFFTANDFLAGDAIWKSDGTAEGTVRLLGGGSPNRLFACGGVLYFNSTSPTAGRELHGIPIAEAASYEQPVPVLSGPATADGPFTLGIDFGREVRVLLPEEVLVENGSVAALRDLGGGLFEIDILPEGLATVSASIPASVVRDLGANANAASEPFSTAMFPSAVEDWIDRGW